MRMSISTLHSGIKEITTVWCHEHTIPTGIYPGQDSIYRRRAKMAEEYEDMEFTSPHKCIKNTSMKQFSQSTD